MFGRTDIRTDFVERDLDPKVLEALEIPGAVVPSIAVQSTPSRSCVYAVRSGEWIKVGATTEFHLRLKSLRTMNPFPVEPVCLLEVHRERLYEVERLLHSILSEDRHVGEWFRCSDDDVEAAVDLAVEILGLRIEEERAL